MKIQQRTVQGLRLAFSSIVTVGALGLSGCGGDAKPITSQTSKYQVAEDNAPVSQPGVNDSAVNGPSSEGRATIPSAIDNSRAGEERPPAAGSTATRPSASSPAAQTQAISPDRSTQSASAGGAPPKPSSQPPGESDAPPTAADGPARLLAHVQKLQGQDPRAATREESISNLVKIQREIVDTASQVISSKADEASMLRAAEAKIRALSLLAQIQREAQGEMKLFVAELKKSPLPKLTRLANRLEFAQMMDSVASGDTTDVLKVLAEFKKVFAEEEKDVALFSLSQQVTEILLNTRHTKEATEVMRLIADTFQGNSNAELANASKMIREQLVVLEVDLDGKVNAVLEGKPKADEEYLAALDKLFGDRELGAMTMQMLVQMAQMIETKNLDLADKTYKKMTVAFAKHSSPELAKAIETMAANFGKRKAIVGKPFNVEGVTLDGQPFDWNKFQGKVVLVDFWATWCGPCLAEIPNIKQNYEQYHEQGFEVVGVNLDDDDAETLQKFFARQRLPWPTVLSPDPQKVGFEHPLAVKCGVEAIPFLVLVGRDGKALALNLRGEDLGKKLATMFTSSAAPPSSPPASDPPAPAKKAG